MKKIYPALLTVFLLLNASAYNSTASQDVSTRRMKGETIRLSVTGKNKVLVHVTFYFTGDFSKPVMMAFPETEWFMLQNFRASWNGRPLKTERCEAPPGHYYSIAGSAYTGIFVYQTTPSSKKINIMEILYEYTAPFYSPGTKEDPGNKMTGYYIEYIIVTGKTWSGTIGSADFYLDPGSYKCGEIRVLEGSYKGNCRKGIYYIRLDDIEPEKNFRFLLPDDE